ncbi:GNAT family N-acetyltransferase [Gloeocapsopsis crepidinum LEGE 06123]|uniref:GNAT family N-acetyltransferase n=1 Tax=Gloeocapsopsis crepidinum LEGE 06123 TaxID=588587 RepID=A0ABR9UZD6_9CHRO|nr:GNAT family N-acetyltransferase [Gloeocapsopsis crepidinum]MBE9193680.1 GNAT family N-acetyltransferase [Gloeocapsopsis crepidinum LEGE 06123]
MHKKPQKNITVRKAKLEDAEAICNVHRVSVRTLCTKDYTPKQIEAWVGKSEPDNFRKALVERGETIFVAEIEELIAGFSSLFKDEIYAVYVHPEYTRRGVGTRLLNAVEKEAIFQPIKKLKLVSSTTAQPFYQANGYQVVEHSFHTLPSGIQIPCVYMEKSLNETDFNTVY